jgi:DNA-binding transcriptional LysR family regulator
VRKLEHLETFVKVVEANSLALAARRLGLCAAAVSKQVSALENDLKLNLLSRTTRRLELTELGHVYYEHCKKVIEKMGSLIFPLMQWI